MADQAIYGEFVIPIVEYYSDKFTSNISKSHNEDAQMKYLLVDEKLKDQSWEIERYFGSGVAVLIYLAVNLYTLGQIKLRKLKQKKSFSQQLMEKHLDSYESYIYWLMMIWLFFLMNCFFQMVQHYSFYRHIENQDAIITNRDHQKQILFQLIALQLTIICQASQGLVIGILRMQEPQFYSHWKVNFKSWFGIYDEADEKSDGFRINILTKQLTYELIYVILDCVSTRMIGKKKSDNARDYARHDFTSESVTEIDYLAIHPEIIMELQD